MFRSGNLNAAQKVSSGHGVGSAALTTSAAPYGKRRCRRDTFGRLSAGILHAFKASRRYEGDQRHDCGQLLQLRVFGLGGDENGDSGVGVFPQREEILIRRAGFDEDGVAINALRGSRL